MRAFPVLCVPAILIAFGVAAAEDPRVVSVNGTGTLYAAPDEAEIGFGVTSDERTLDAAKKANAEAGAQLLKAVRALGVAEKDIQTARLNVSPIYKDEDHPKKGVESYQVSRRYVVKLKDLAKLDELIDRVLAEGANEIESLDLKAAAPHKQYAEARKQALAAAKEKAQTMAAELGCKIGAPRSIQEGSYELLGQQRVTGAVGNPFAAAPGAPAEGGSLPLGQIGFRAYVSVTFDLVP